MRRWMGELLALAGMAVCLWQLVQEDVWQFGFLLGACAVVFGVLIALDAQAYREESRRPGYIYGRYGGTDGD